MNEVQNFFQKLFTDGDKSMQEWLDRTTSPDTSRPGIVWPLLHFKALHCTLSLHSFTALFHCTDYRTCDDDDDDDDDKPV